MGLRSNDRDNLLENPSDRKSTTPLWGRICKTLCRTFTDIRLKRVESTQKEDNKTTKV